MMELEASIISILNKNGVPVGTGFLVGDGVALTCAHVIDNITSLQIAGEIDVQFPFLSSGEKYRARVTFYDEKDDIAEIALDSVPLDAKPTHLIVVDRPLNHEFKAYGFPSGHSDGVWARGVLIQEIANGWLQIEDTKQQGIRVQEGFSGTPVWDETINGVVGMVVAAKRDETAKLAFCIPAKTLLDKVPKLSVNRSLPPCPYQGLNHFTEEHAGLFFGREYFVDQLEEAVQKTSFISVLGASGSGKSSVVFAGLVPRLRRQNSWVLIDLRPGSFPIDALAAALINVLEPELSEAERIRDVGILRNELSERDRSLFHVLTRIQRKLPHCNRILIIIDQFEELYTQVTDSKERNRFIDILLEAVKDQPKTFATLVTLRADFLGHALAYRSLAEALQHTDLKLGPMNYDELREAIEEPAKTHNVTFEPGVVDLILNHVKRNPDSLPLLEFALTQMWERQENRKLTLKAYQEIGGVEDALSQYADSVFSKLNNHELEQARRLFTRLISFETGFLETRRIATRSELEDTDTALIEIFVKNRLVMTDRTPAGRETIEIVHEALINGCKMLHDWIEIDREFLAWLAQLRVAIVQWRENGTNESGLLSGLNLSKAEKWFSQRPHDVGPEERHFITLSIDLKKREQIQQNRIRTSIIVSRTLFIIIILAVLTVSYINIKAQRDNARAGQLAAQSQLIKAIYPQQSLLLALEALNTTSPPLPVAEQALWDALADIGGIALSGHAKPITTLAFSPNSQWVATGSGDATVRLWSLKNLPSNSTYVLSGHNATIESIAFSPDNNWLAVGSWDTTITLWNFKDSFSQPRTLYGHIDGVTALAFSPDGRWLATGGQDTAIILWDLQATDIQSSRKFLIGAQQAIQKLIFSPDGRWLAVKDGIDAIVLWDLTSRNPSDAFLKLEHLDKGIISFAFSPNSHWLASAGSDQIVHLWDLSEPAEENFARKLYGHEDQIQALSFSPDSHWLATGGWDKTVRLWDLTSSDGQSNSLLLSSSDEVLSLEFSPSGRWLATGDSKGITQLWDLVPLSSSPRASLTEPRVFHGNLGLVRLVTFSPDERWLASIGSDNVAWLWNLMSDDPARDPTVLPDINGATPAFSPDGHWLGTTSSTANITAQLWDMSDRPAAPFNILTTNLEVSAAISSTNSGWLAAAGSENQVFLWRTNNIAAAPVELVAHTDKINAMAFNSSETVLATAGSDNKVCLWNIPLPTVLSNPTQRQCLSGYPSWVSDIAISPDSRWLATAASDRTVQLKDLSTDSTQGLEVLQTSGLIYQVKFSPDSRWLAIGSGDSKAQLWDMNDRAQPVLLREHTSAIPALDFSLDEHWLATGGIDGTVRLWDLTDPFPPGRSSHHVQLNSGVYVTRFSNDSQLLAAAGTDTKVYLWKLTSDNPFSEPYKILAGHSGPIRDLVISPSGRWLATGSEDNTIRLWNLASDDPARNVIVLRGHKNTILSLLFTADEHWLISGSTDQTARYWNMSLDELKQLACTFAARNFLQSEWDQYFPGEKYRGTCPQQ